MVDLIKVALIPGSLLFLLVGLTAGVAGLHAPGPLRRLSRTWLTVLMAWYWIMSVPAASNMLATRFGDGSQHTQSASALASAAAIVVLGAGIRTFVADGDYISVPDIQSAFNAMEAARLYALRPLPIVVSGGFGTSMREGASEAMVLRDLLTRAGVPADDIVLEADSRTTLEQARNVAPMLKSRRWNTFVLITSPVHMLRALAIFRAQGVQPIPAIARFSSVETQPLPRWEPDKASLGVSQRANYDYLAWVYYWVRGRFKPVMSPQ